MLFFITRNICKGRIRVSQRWLKCTHTQGQQCNSFLVYIIFWTFMQSSWSHLPPMCCMWTWFLFSMPPTQPPWYFCWGNTCILFTLGNKWTSCYTTPTAFLLGHRPVYPRIQAHILLCHPRNLCVMSKESSCRNPTNADYVIWNKRWFLLVPPSLLFQQAFKLRKK